MDFFETTGGGDGTSKRGCLGVVVWVGIKERHGNTIQKIGEGVITQQNDTCKGKNNESTSSGDDEGMTVICFNI